MYCSACGQHLRDDAHFCDHCGASTELPGAVTNESPVAPSRTYREVEVPAEVPYEERPVAPTHTYYENEDPYKDQIAQLKLELKQVKLELKRVNADLSATRAQHNTTAAFVPRGTLRRGYKMFEDMRLWGPQQQKQALQQEIINMEQELLDLQQAQVQWKLQQQA
ncbi:MAG: zinc ribbon domain-containing protein [Chloroflexota bacterium]|nr:zinc ribbon domain-containing protein [Chloroflexota bacterium]